MKDGLVLDKVVLLGRTLDEYRRFFALDLDRLRDKRILDVAAGVGSFCAEGNTLGIRVTAFDAIYNLSEAEIRRRCEIDLDRVTNAIGNLKTYRWNFYRSPEILRQYRERAYRGFLDDYQVQRNHRYVQGLLPELPFSNQEFDLSLSSYLMFVYEDQFDYEFHKRSVLEIMRVTRGEARFYPIVTFEAKRSSYLDRLAKDAELRHLGFEEEETDFEFLANSNWYLRVFHR